MGIRPEETVKIARLAKLELTAQELEAYGADLEAILTWMEILEHVPSDTLKRSRAQPGVLREDEVTNAPDAEFGLSQAPAREGGFFRVPRVLD